MELCTREESAQAVADKFGVCRPTLYNWKNQLLGREAPPSMKSTNQSPSLQERDELERQVEALRREVRQLRLEQDLLNKANELLKKGLGVDLQFLSNREKWAAAGLIDTDLSFLSFLELYRTDVAERRMTARRVVEPLDVVEHVGSGLFSGPVHLSGCALSLQ